MKNTLTIKRCVKLTSTRDLEVYSRRQKQSNPNLPKIKIGQRKQQMLTVYIQSLTAPYHFQTWKKLPQKLLLDHLQSSIVALIQLKKRFGCFKILQTSYRMNDRNQVKVWINEDIVLNYRQSPLPHQPYSQFLMVGGIIKLFKPLLHELDDIVRPDTLQQLLNQITKIRSPGTNIIIPEIDSSPISPKLNLKNFFQTKTYKPVTQRSIPHNITVDQLKKKISNQSNYVNSSNQNPVTEHKKNSSSPFSPLSPVSTWRSPRNSVYPALYKKSSDTLAQEKCKKKISFIYSNGDGSSEFSSPQKQKTIKTRDKQKHTYTPVLNPLLDLSFGSKKSYELDDPEDSQYQRKRKESKQLEKSKVNKFPNSTKSTFVTLTSTKNLGDIPLQIQEQNCDNIHQHTNIKKSTLEIKNEDGDLQQQFSNLFDGQGQQDNCKQDQEFESRQQQFEQILFS